MANPVLIDTGPIVGVLNRNDQWHEWAVEEMKRIEPPFFSCDAVISEALFLLERTHGKSREGLFHFLNSDSLDLSFSLGRERSTIIRYLKKYEDLPMSLADACLVRMVELHPEAHVFTTDRDFSIYRTADRRKIPLIAPPQM